MAAQYGRTVQDYEKLLMGAAGGSMYDMKINGRSDLGTTVTETEMSAWSDVGKGYLTGQADFSLDFSGPIDNTATSGPSTLLKTWFAAKTLLSFDLQQGVQHAWEAGEPQFGMTGVVSSNSGVIVTKYTEAAGVYNATIRVKAGSAVYPAFGIAAEAVPS